MPMECASSPTLCPTATRTKDTTQPSRLASAWRAPHTLKESARQFPNADRTSNTTETPVTASKDSQKRTASARGFQLPLHAHPTPTLMESHAPATMDSTRAASVTAHPAPKELHGTEPSARTTPAPTATSSTAFPTSVSLRVPHAGRTPTGTEQCACAPPGSISSTESASSARPPLPTTAPSAPARPSTTHPSPAAPTKSTSTASAHAARDSTGSRASASTALPTPSGTDLPAHAPTATHPNGASESPTRPSATDHAAAKVDTFQLMESALLHPELMIMDNLFPYFCYSSLSLHQQSYKKYKHYMRNMLYGIIMGYMPYE